MFSAVKKEPSVMNVRKKIDESFVSNLIKRGILKLDKNGEIWRQYHIRPHDKQLIKIKIRKIGHISQYGYKDISVPHNRKKYTFRAHRIIWVYHHGRIPEGKVINHIDGNRTNNRIENLEVVTYSENTIHSFKNNLRVIKLTSDEVSEMKYLLKIGYPVKFLSKKYNISTQHVIKIKNGKSWSFVK